MEFINEIVNYKANLCVRRKFTFREEEEMKVSVGVPCDWQRLLLFLAFCIFFSVLYLSSSVN